MTCWLSSSVPPTEHYITEAAYPDGRLCLKRSPVWPTDVTPDGLCRWTHGHCGALGFPNTSPGRRSMSILATGPLAHQHLGRSQCWLRAGLWVEALGQPLPPAACAWIQSRVQTACDTLARLSIPTRPLFHFAFALPSSYSPFSSSVLPFSSPLFFPLGFFIPVCPSASVWSHHPPRPVTPTFPGAASWVSFSSPMNPAFLGRNPGPGAEGQELHPSCLGMALPGLGSLQDWSLICAEIQGLKHLPYFNSRVGACLSSPLGKTMSWMGQWALVLWFLPAPWLPKVNAFTLVLCFLSSSSSLPLPSSPLLSPPSPSTQCPQAFPRPAAQPGDNQPGVGSSRTPQWDPDWIHPQIRGL